MIQDKIDALDGIDAALVVSKKWLSEAFQEETDPIMISSVKALHRALDVALQTTKNIERHYDGLVTEDN